MSPSQFYSDNGDDSRNADNNDLNIGCLGISKVSHCIKKSSPSSSTSSASSLTTVGRNGADRGRSNVVVSNNGKAQHRHPVIIYTHSPKIIQTHPRDFMALVQKLTGLSQMEEEETEASTFDPKMEDRDGKNNGGGSEDTDASSVMEEHGTSSGGEHGHVNSCYNTPSILDRPINGPNMSVPFYMPNNSDFFCSNNHPGYYNFGDHRLLNFKHNNNNNNNNNNNIRNPFSYLNFQIRMNDFGDFSKNLDF